MFVGHHPSRLTRSVSINGIIFDAFGDQEVEAVDEAERHATGTSLNHSFFRLRTSYSVQADSLSPTKRAMATAGHEGLK